MSTQPITVKQSLIDAAKDYKDGIINIFSCPREIWISYGLNVLDSIVYFSSMLVLMSFLITDMGLTDVKAGTVFGLVSASMSFFMLFVGFISDSVGIKRAFLLGIVLGLCGRLGLTFSTAPTIVYPSLFLMSLGFSFMTPLLPASVKIYSTKKAQKYAFSWFYVVMNIGALIAGMTLDSLRTTFTQPLHFNIGSLNLTTSPTQMIFFFSVICTIIMLFFALSLRHKIPAEAYKETPEDTKERKKDTAKKHSEKKAFWTIAKEVGSEKTFWIFMLFIILLVLVKMIFQYNHALYPVYMERIGLKAWTGKLYSINPIIIIFLVPVMTALTGKLKAYSVIIVGTFVSACSVLFMTLGEAIIFVVLFQIMLSLGEALWSPRLYEYTASITPKGKESSYMAMSQMPMFFAKVIAGPMAGYFLTELCPAKGERNTELMWFLVSMSIMIAPFILLFGRKFLDVSSKGAGHKA